MAINQRLNQILALAMSLMLLAMPLAAQQRRVSPSAPKQPTHARQELPPPTFDTLLAADDYKVYGEIKNLGQLIRSPNVADILDPVMKLASPPKEFKSLVKFANTHAELLATSRMFFAAWPAKTKLPEALFGIEFSSTEEAAKFEPQLRQFLPKILPPPAPPISTAVVVVPRAQIRSSTEPVASDLLEVHNGDSVDVLESVEVQDPQDNAKTERWSRVRAHNEKFTEGWIEARNIRLPEAVASGTSSPEAKQADTKVAPLPFVIKQLGNLVLISDSTFNVKDLRPAGSELLFDNPNFHQAHDRLGSEAIFLFFNVALDERKRMGEDNELSERQKKPDAVVIEEAAAIPARDTEKPAEPVVMGQMEPPAELRTEGAPPTSGDPDAAAENAQAVLTAENPTAQTGNGPQLLDMDLGLGLIFGSLFGGKPKYPEAVGVAIVFEGDSYAARVLMVGGLDGKPSPVPFISQWVSGPALTLEAASILPADTELFVAASLDTAQIYEGLVKAINDQSAEFQRTSERPHNETAPVAPFAELEKKLGLKVKEDLLPVLGYEIAVSIPVSTLTGPTVAATPAAGAEKDQTAAKASARSPVILISLKDKDAAHLLLPRIVEGLGFKGAGMFAQTTKSGDTEIVSYANVFSYAFVGNFLVLSLDAASTKHVVDSYLDNKTLSSDSQYQTFTRWQPRQVLGQIYLSPALMESYRTYANHPTALVSDTVREFLARLSPVSEPVTYALSSDGVGPLHELHVPKNLILMLVAAISSESNQSPLIKNEQLTRYALMSIANSETRYQKNQGKGHYASLDQLIEQNMVSKEMLQEYGYRIELNTSGDSFTATAVPNEYNKTGRLSYFVDETGIVRGGDHGGAPATAADTPIQ